MANDQQTQPAQKGTPQVADRSGHSTWDGPEIPRVAGKAGPGDPILTRHGPHCGLRRSPPRRNSKTHPAYGNFRTHFTDYQNSSPVFAIAAKCHGGQPVVGQSAGFELISSSYFILAEPFRQGHLPNSGRLGRRILSALAHPHEAPGDPARRNPWCAGSPSHEFLEWLCRCDMQPIS